LAELPDALGNAGLRFSLPIPATDVDVAGGAVSHTHQETHARKSGKARKTTPRRKSRKNYGVGGCRLALRNYGDELSWAVAMERCFE
jgi:hypothetical protein